MIGALTIGSVALPEMLRLGYGKRIASGVIAAGGTLSVLIPPSLILLFYGIVTEASIGQLFIAGVIPGLMLTGFFVIVILDRRMLRPNDIPESDRGGKWLMKDTLLALAPVVVIAFVIIASIYFGIVPTWFVAGEAAPYFAMCRDAGRGLSTEAAIRALRAMAEWDVSERLGEVSVPALVICGDRDRSTAPDQSWRLWEGIPDSRLCIVPGCAHNVHLERPELFSDIVLDFLTGG